MADAFGDALARALREHGLSALSTEAFQRCVDLQRHVEQWSRAVGLTGFSSLEETVRRYYIEPLAALPWMPDAGRCLDVGSGGGSPALPMAIARPHLEWALIESDRRKALFLDEVVRALGLRAEVRQERFENVTVARTFDVVTVRGVRVTKSMRERVVGSMARGGRWLWFSGEETLQRAGRELGGEEALVVEGPRRLLVGGRSGHLLVVRRGRSLCFT